jgi:hypothetical protein
VTDTIVEVEKIGFVSTQKMGGIQDRNNQVWVSDHGFAPDFLHWGGSEEADRKEVPDESC